MRAEYEVAEKSKLPTNINQQALPPRRAPLTYTVGYQPFKTDQNRRSVAKMCWLLIYLKHTMDTNKV